MLSNINKYCDPHNMGKFKEHKNERPYFHTMQNWIKGKTFSRT